jgi:hypothetical protein
MAHDTWRRGSTHDETRFKKKLQMLQRPLTSEAAFQRALVRLR